MSHSNKLRPYLLLARILAPRQTPTDIHTCVIKLISVSSEIPYHQSAAYGYTGIIKQRKVYTLTGEIPWYNFGDPGPL